MIRRFLFAYALAALAAIPALAQPVPIPVATNRDPALIAPLIDTWRLHNNGLIFPLDSVPAGLIDKLRGADAAKANLLVVAGAGLAADLAAAGLTQPIRDKAILDAIPAPWRDPQGHWVALSLRPRVIYLSRDRVPAAERPTYEDLADSRWKGRLCLGSPLQPENVSLFAALLKKQGEAKLTAYLTALRSNLARPAAGGDRDVARLIQSGACDVGIGGLDEAARMMSGKAGAEAKQAADTLRILVPTFRDKAGTHVDIVAALLPKQAPRREEGLRLLDFLVTLDAERYYAQMNLEIPVRDGVDLPPLLAAFGPVRPDPITPAQSAEARKTVGRIVAKVGFER